MAAIAYALIAGFATIAAAWITAHVARLEQRVEALERWRADHEHTPRIYRP
jgi:hypothetical protein